MFKLHYAFDNIAFVRNNKIVFFDKEMHEEEEKQPVNISKERFDFEDDFFMDQAYQSNKDINIDGLN